MARAGERTSFCTFKQPGPPNTLGEQDPALSSWATWGEAWGKKRGLRGGELVLARESESQTTVEFYFDYADVIDPQGDGTRLTSSMVIVVDNGTPGGEIYDIDAIFAEEVQKREVRVMAILKRNAM